MFYLETHVASTPCGHLNTDLAIPSASSENRAIPESTCLCHVILACPMRRPASLIVYDTIHVESERRRRDRFEVVLSVAGVESDTAPEPQRVKER